MRACRMEVDRMCGFHELFHGMRAAKRSPFGHLRKGFQLAMDLLQLPRWLEGAAYNMHKLEGGMRARGARGDSWDEEGYTRPLDIQFGACHRAFSERCRKFEPQSILGGENRRPREKLPRPAKKNYCNAGEAPEAPFSAPKSKKVSPTIGHKIKMLT